MSKEVALTLIVPSVIVTLGLLGLALINKIRRWQKRRTIERGVRDLVQHVRSGDSVVSDR